jgi:hypothetical protein
MLDATPLLRLHARRRARFLEAADPVGVQRAQLQRLLTTARDTLFGREHGFSSIAGPTEFQQRVKLRRYEDFWADYWQAAFPVLREITWPRTIPYFAVTSGTTTGKTKYIPVSRDMLASNRRAALDLLTFHVLNRPRSRIFAGKNFMLGGSTALTPEAPGIHSGDLSGIAANEVPWWARPRFFPPPDLALIADWETKIAALAKASLATDIRAIGGTPSWLLIFFDKLAELRPGGERHLAAFYPDLELLIHGGVNFAPYHRRFEALLEGSHAELREVYPASEGFIAVADRGPDEGLRLILDHGLFYEFVPVTELGGAQPVRHWLATIETGIDYAVVVSSCAGLWAYILGDTVRFVDRSPPRLLITGRTSYTLSAFGEHLIGEEVERAVAVAAQAIGADVADYSVGPLHPEKPGELGGHLYIVEFAEGIPAAQPLRRFAEILDTELQSINDDYRAHRSGGFGLTSPRIEAMPPGFFAAWMKARGRLGGQNKVPRIIADPALFEKLRAFAAVSPGRTGDG